MTNLIDMITTLQQAQEAIAKLEEWKQIIFSDADLCLKESYGHTNADEIRRMYKDMHNETRDLMAEMGILKEWKENSEVYAEWKKQREESKKTVR